MRIPKSRKVVYRRKNGAQSTKAARKARRQRIRMSDGPWNGLRKLIAAIGLIVQRLASRRMFVWFRPRLFIGGAANAEKLLDCYLVGVALAPLFIRHGPLVETALDIDVCAFVELHGESGEVAVKDEVEPVRVFCGQAVA